MHRSLWSRLLDSYPTADILHFMQLSMSLEPFADIIRYHLKLALQTDLSEEFSLFLRSLLSHKIIDFEINVTKFFNDLFCVRLCTIFPVPTISRSEVSREDLLRHLSAACKSIFMSYQQSALCTSFCAIFSSSTLPLKWRLTWRNINLKRAAMICA
jgi:hypothetical protein